MSNATITKQAIAQSMKHLMEKKPFDQISTQDIIEKSGISRKTFYYHFKDKYDLVNWIFKSEVMDDIIESTTFSNWMNGSLKLCTYMQQNKAFYMNAINISGQNSFVKYMYNMTELQISLLCSQAAGGRTLAPDDLKFIVDFYYNAFIGVFMPWVNADMKDNPELIVQRWKCAVDNTLVNFIERMAK